MRALLLLALVGCDGGVVLDTDVGPDTDTDSETDTGSDTDVCPALYASAEPPALNPQQRGQVRVTGGVAPMRYAIASSGTGAIVSEVTGEYLAGPDPGTDTIRVTDACGSSTEAQFSVIPRLEVLPREAVIPPDTTVVLDIFGGSADVRCTVELDRSGGSLDQCAWTSGRGLGTDVVRVTDEVTGDVVRVDLTVRPDAALSVPEVVVALQHNPLTIPVEGGSGHHDLTVVSGDSHVLDGVDVDATFSGEAQVRVADRYVPGLFAITRVVVAEALSPTPQVDGVTDSLMPVVTEDLDGDGFTDAVVALPNANTMVHRGGMVLVYRGVAGGLESVPTQVFEGTWRFGQFGRSVAVGDLTGDGVVDLVIGAEQHRSSNGRVTVHAGVGDGTFSERPWATVDADFGGDRLGTAVAVCDIDADGQLDLLASARTRDDRDAVPSVSDVGMLYAWTASPLGVSLQPVWTAMGVEEAGAGFASSRQELGRNLRTGDIDGDGRCDVVSSMLRSDTVVTYLSGDAADGEWLPATPSRLYRAESGHEDFDWALEVADVDGDDLDDILVGGWRTDGTPPNRSGGVYIYLAADDDGRPATEPLLRAEASLSLVGSESNEELGVSVGVDDIDGDGIIDVWAGGMRSDAEVNNSGGVQWWSGADLRASELGAVLSEADAAGGVFGTQPESGYGVGAGFLPHADAWVVTEGRGDRLGPRVGDVYLARQTVPPQPLSWPVHVGGALVGWDDSMALFDDGALEPALLVAAPLDAVQPNGVDAGQVVTLDGATQTRWYSLPDDSGPVMPDLRAGLHTGWRLGPVGDVDGDGTTDLAVVARVQRDRPDLYRDLVSNPDACRQNSGGVGMVAVYRGGEPAGVPDYLAYGPLTNGRIERVVGGDLNGDGYGDLVFTSVDGSPDYISVAYGVPDQAGAVVLCDVWSAAPRGGSEAFGEQLIALGDVDGDGCDDVAVSAPSSDPGGSNRGAVWVLFGWGERCETDAPRHTGLAGTLNNERLGTGMAVADIDGDGVRDLLVGAPDRDGGRLYSLPVTDIVAAATPVTDGFDDATLVMTERLAGTQSGADFGRTVAVVEDGGRPWIVVGEPHYDEPTGDDDVDPVLSIGRVHLYRWLDGALERAGVVGLDQSHDPRAAQGAELGLGLVGADGTLLIGAPRSSSVYRDHGAVYRVDLR